MTLVEVLIASVVAALAFFTALTVFHSSYTHAARSRNRAVGTVLARSLLDEVKAHPYGAQPPANWTASEVTPAQVWIQGRPIDMKFHARFTYLNSSFVTPGSSQDSDIVTITLSWRESGGNAHATNTSGDDNQQLVVQVPVWR